VGAKFKAVLDSVSAPHGEDNERTGAERRLQGLDGVLSSILDHGLPSDKGVRPHMSVFADADTIEAAAEHVKNETENPHSPHNPAPGEPAKLAGFGSIGPSLLMYFLCISDVTAFLMTQGGGRRQAQILNVGRTYRLATMKQRRGVIARQQGVCAAPGCHHTHLEIHHVIWYSRGGTTDVDLLIGLCRRLGPSQEARSGEGAPPGPQEPADDHRQRGRRFLRRGYALTAEAPFSPPAPADRWVDDDEPATTRPPDTHRPAAHRHART
jgi:hypothetical protein